jgi:hypothetical protein
VGRRESQDRRDVPGARRSRIRLQASGSSLQAIAPIVRPAMQMRDREHEDVIFVEGVDQRVRESAKTTAANAFAERLAKAQESARCGRRPIGPQSETHCRGQTTAFRIIGLPDRIRSRRSQETGASRPILGNNIAQVLGRKLTAPVSRQPIVRLLRPESIDVGVGTIQTVEHVLNQRDAILRR